MTKTLMEPARQVPVFGEYDVVVLGGGTAVLGTSGGFGDGEANFLAFCAIGILAGMFSDRVAQWLSGRADAFFSRDRAHAE